MPWFHTLDFQMAPNVHWNVHSVFAYSAFQRLFGAISFSMDQGHQDTEEGLGPMAWERAGVGTLTCLLPGKDGAGGAAPWLASCPGQFDIPEQSRVLARSALPHPLRARGGEGRKRLDAGAPLPWAP